MRGGLEAASSRHRQSPQRRRGAVSDPSHLQGSTWAPEAGPSSWNASSPRTNQGPVSRLSMVKTKSPDPDGGRQMFVGGNWGSPRLPDFSPRDLLVPTYTGNGRKKWGCSRRAAHNPQCVSSQVVTPPRLPTGGGWQCGSCVATKAEYPSRSSYDQSAHGTDTLSTLPVHT